MGGIVNRAATSNHIADRKERSFWLKHLHRWHWISAAVSLVAMLLFAATGITLNHAARIESKPKVENRKAQLPAPLLAQLAQTPREGNQPIPAPLREWLGEHLPVRAGERLAEWSQDEMVLPLPRPGGDAWVSIDLASGEVEYESTDRGWVSYFNDLHKGRNTGEAWSWFIDIFAIASLVFGISGLFLLHLYSENRPYTWPLVSLGVLIPVLLAILFIH